MRAAILALLTGLSTLLSGCAGPEVHDYAREQPQLDLRRYFDGDLIAHGLFSDRSGQVQRRFIVHMKARWQGDQGTLEEDFRYSDGSTERRVWHLTRLPDGRYIGRAADVIGEAQGESAGNALRWRYTLDLPVGERRYAVQFDDWMFMMDDKTLLNRATMSKFGLRLGEVTLAFRKLSPP